MSFVFLGVKSRSVTFDQVWQRLLTWSYQLAELILGRVYSRTDAECRVLDAHNESANPVTESAASPGALAHWEKKSSFSPRAAGSAQKDR